VLQRPDFERQQMQKAIDVTSPGRGAQCPDDLSSTEAESL